MKKFIQVSTLIEQEEYDLLVKAFGENGVASILEERLDSRLIYDLLDEARKYIMANPKLFPSEEEAS